MKSKLIGYLLSILLLGLTVAAPAQTSTSDPAKPATAPDADKSATSTAENIGEVNEEPSPGKDDEEVTTLSPFTVETTTDENSYRANSTLAGTRVRTDLDDVASSISVVTSQFMKDIAATNNQTLLAYTTNTEVAGPEGNFAAAGNTFVEGAGEASLGNPNTNTRVRGLDSADNTRDYFLSDIPWDSYNIGRIDIQRGPNSILFGIGSPAGIINASVNTAGFKTTREVQVRAGSFGSLRKTADFNEVLVPGQLAVRLSLLDDNTKYRQEPAYNHDKRIFGALRFEPAAWNRGRAHTSFRANYEHGAVDANRPRVLPPFDQITPFFTGFDKTTYDFYYAYATGIVATSTTTTKLGEQPNYWLSGNYLGMQFAAEPRINFDALQSGAPAILATERPPAGNGPTATFAIGPNGQVDRSIDGLPFRQSDGIVSYNKYTINANAADPTLFPAAASGFYKSPTLSDPSIFDFYNHLLDGPNKWESQGWDAVNLVLDQTFFNNRLGIELVYDNQRYEQKAESNGIGNAISVDIQANSLNTLPWAYGYVTKYNGSGQAGTNPNAGRAYVGSTGNAATGSSRTTERENYRATVFGELRADDFLPKGWLTRLLGRHRLTGLYSTHDYDQLTLSWARYAVEGAWDNAIGTGTGLNGSGMSSILSGSRVIPLSVYISDPLFDQTLGAGLHLTPITTDVTPSGMVNIKYFDSHWKWPANPNDPAYVDPAAAWMNPTGVPNPTASTQSENPANYVGWTEGSFRILNADQGDIDSLYTSASRLRQKYTSEGLTWQGYLWDDMIVGTIGWRRDRQTQQSGYGQLSPVTGAVSPQFELDPESDTVRGTSRSWGVVLHEPRAWRDQLPWGTKISLTYNEGENFRVQNRYGFDGNPLPGSKGTTRDYGFRIDTLHDRLSLKVTWYKTTVKDANISSVLTSASSLGASAYGLWLYPKWALGAALQGLAGMAGDPAANNFSYVWNWALASDPTNHELADVTSDAFKNHPETIREKAAIEAFLENMPSQAFWDAYGTPINVAAAKAGDWNNAIDGWKVSQGNWEIPGNTSINGVEPVGTVDNVSKGVEIEIVGQLSKNWNVAINASKQTASQAQLGAQFMAVLEEQSAFYATPAGDLSLWVAPASGGTRVGDDFENTIGAAYRFQKETNGKLVPEMSPWRFNAVTSYRVDHGFFKGVSGGLAYRWQQGQILGYALKADKSNLDVNQPYWGKALDAVDLWIGYEHKFKHGVEWGIQLNVRNVGQSVGLVPISVQPDGTTALQRIREGQTWALTNTFSF